MYKIIQMCLRALEFKCTAYTYRRTFGILKVSFVCFFFINLIKGSGLYVKRLLCQCFFFNEEKQIMKYRNRCQCN